jgi:ssDNA-binding replication factor A large subunit
VRAIIADETGKVKGFFFENDALKEGKTVVILKAKAAVVNEHIEMKLMKGGRI